MKDPRTSHIISINEHDEFTTNFSFSFVWLTNLTHTPFSSPIHFDHIGCGHHSQVSDKPTKCPFSFRLPIIRQSLGSSRHD